jgi:hypothetical protein
VERGVTSLNTPQAAVAAGFRPVLGNIPGMGTHYIHPGRSRDAVTVDEPDHLLFAPVDGEERLVGVAYAFPGAVDAAIPPTFESELAHWHDHPELAAGGETLHMLHVWFVPSSNGPFAGLNFWLPFEGAGIAAPSACWMADETDAARIQRVAFSLAAAEGGASILRGLPAARAALTAMAAERDNAERAEADQSSPRGTTAAAAAGPSATRQGLLEALDTAARAEDRDAWVAAADLYLADLTAVERTVVDRLLLGLTAAQMSTPEREATGQQQGRFRQR